jgi:hypothetical protein
MRPKMRARTQQEYEAENVALRRMVDELQKLLPQSMVSAMYKQLQA